VGSNNITTSNITFKGTEDLGGGLKGGFLYEIDPGVAQNTTLNAATTSNGQVYTGASAVNGEAYVNLSGAFGDIKAGTPNSPALIAGVTIQPFGTALGGGFSSGFGRLGTAGASGINQYVGGPSSGGRIIRHEKAAVYTTPTFSGFNAQIEYSGKNANSGTYTSNDNGVLGLTANYSNGPLNAVFNSTKASAGAVQAAGTFATLGTAAANVLAANASTKWTIAGANYTMGAATLYAGYTTTKTDGLDGLLAATAKEDSKSWNLAGKYVIGQFDLLANYLERKSNLTVDQAYPHATTSGAAAASAVAAGDYTPTQKLLGLGVNYNLSKLTSVYARYEQISGLNVSSAATLNGVAAVAAAGGATQKTTAVGIKVAF